MVVLRLKYEDFDLKIFISDLIALSHDPAFFQNVHIEQQSKNKIAFSGTEEERVKFYLYKNLITDTLSKYNVEGKAQWRN